MIEIDRVRTEIEDLAAALGTMRMLVQAGDVIDLNGLDERITAVNASVTALAEPSRSTMRPSIVNLLDAISALQISIIAARDSLSEEIKGVGLRHQAASAYGRGGGKGGRDGSSGA